MGAMELMLLLRQLLVHLTRTQDLYSVKFSSYDMCFLGVHPCDTACDTGKSMANKELRNSILRVGTIVIRANVRDVRRFSKDRGDGFSPESPCDCN